MHMHIMRFKNLRRMYCLKGNLQLVVLACNLFFRRLKQEDKFKANSDSLVGLCLKRKVKRVGMSFDDRRTCLAFLAPGSISS